MNARSAAMSAASGSPSVPPGLDQSKLRHQPPPQRLQPPLQLAPREVYSLLVHHGLKSEVAAPFLDFGVDSDALFRFDAFPKDFPAMSRSDEVRGIVAKVWQSTRDDIRASSRALESLPVCVLGAAESVRMV